MVRPTREHGLRLFPPQRHSFPPSRLPGTGRYAAALMVPRSPARCDSIGAIHDQRGGNGRSSRARGPRIGGRRMDLLTELVVIIKGFLRTCQSRRLRGVDSVWASSDFRCVHESFSTLQRLAPLQRQNSHLTALRQLPLRPLRFAGRGPEKSSNRAPEVA